MLMKIANKDTQTVIRALIKQAKALPNELYKSPYRSSTFYVSDQHRRLLLRSAKSVAARVEREHQWPAETVLSEGHRLSVHSQAHLNKVARQLNERPRETLQFETPAERFNACVASTG